MQGNSDTPGSSDLEARFAADLPAYAPGQVVRHTRYGYRGVVVDFDMQCTAEPAWYHANKTQPDRDQPWYHVLVHGTTHATYAAQEHLLPDLTGQPVDHPLTPVFFDRFASGRHDRNDTPWPEGD